jgi:hypothetical protein
LVFKATQCHQNWAPDRNTGSCKLHMKSYGNHAEIFLLNGQYREIPPPFFFIKSSHLGPWFISQVFFVKFGFKFVELLLLKFDSPLHHAAGSQISPLHHVAGSHISPLHHAAGSQISLLHVAAGSQISPLHFAAERCDSLLHLALESQILLLQNAAGSQILLLYDAAGSQILPLYDAAGS